MIKTIHMALNIHGVVHRLHLLSKMPSILFLLVYNTCIYSTAPQLFVFVKYIS